MASYLESVPLVDGTSEYPERLTAVLSARASAPAPPAQLPPGHAGRAPPCTNERFHNNSTVCHYVRHYVCHYVVAGLVLSLRGGSLLRVSLHGS